MGWTVRPVSDHPPRSRAPSAPPVSGDASVTRSGGASGHGLPAVTAPLLAALLAAAAVAPAPLSGQEAGPRGTGSSTAYDPLALFDQDFLEGPVPETRSASGRPGPAYWQNRADYDIEARLHPDSRRVTASERITYTNASPDSLGFLWILLPHNRFREGSRSDLLDGRRQAGTGGVEIRSVRLEREGGTVAVDYRIVDTRMKVDLPTALAPGGGADSRLVLRVDFAFTFPEQARSAWGETPHGPVFEATMWYPRVAVYDDVHGWNTLPFLGAGEFYLEFGDFEYAVTVPRDYLVMGSGELQNPGEVLTDRQRRRLAEARGSDSTLWIRRPGEVDDPASRPDGEGPLTWRFRMERTRDVAWGASPAFAWDAARIDLPEGRTALAMSAYPPESAVDSLWGPATQMAARSIEIFSRDWYPYPWSTAVSVGGPVGGMEWPGLVTNHWRAGGYLLFLLQSHEHGHNWFPMIVGTDERRNAWMDEGFNTFIDIYAHEEYENGRYAPKRDGEYAPEGGDPAREIVKYLTHPASQPMSTRYDLVNRRFDHHLAYYKSALGLVMLREYVLGPDRFDEAFRAYIRRWAFRHPRPEDFYRTMSDVTGEDLTWFWKGWIERDWTLDQAVDRVSYVDGDPARGARITLRNLRRFAMPVELEIRESDGDTARVRLPVEIWQQGGEYIYVHGSDSRLDAVTLDPDRQLPDVVPGNNRWRRNPR